MANYGWDAVPARIRMPISGGTVNGEPFSVPKGTLAMTVCIPTLAASATCKVEALFPAADDKATDTWYAVSAFGTGTPFALAAIPGNAATTLPIATAGGGVLRFVASSDQSGAPVTIGVVFHLAD